MPECKHSVNDVLTLAENAETVADLEREFDCIDPGFYSHSKQLALPVIGRSFQHYSAGTILHLTRHPTWKAWP